MVSFFKANKREFHLYEEISILPIKIKLTFNLVWLNFDNELNILWMSSAKAEDLDHSIPVIKDHKTLANSDYKSLELRKIN